MKNPKFNELQRGGKIMFFVKQLLKHSAIDLSRGVRAENAPIFYHRVRSHGERASQRS